MRLFQGRDTGSNPVDATITDIIKLRMHMTTPARSNSRFVAKGSYEYTGLHRPGS